LADEEIMNENDEAENINKETDNTASLNEEKTEDAGKCDASDNVADNTGDADAVKEGNPSGQAAETAGKARKDKKGKKEKKEKKDSKDLKIEELNDRLLRLMAEYENYRKRTDKEKSAMYEMGAKSVVEKIIPVIDNFERGFATVTDEQKENPFVQGMDKVYKQMTGSLGEAGLKVIEAVGQEFDPNIHEAVMHVEDDSVGENIVVEELQKGYMYRDSLVRCSMVKVAN
jgi:molecular chaperone GrpE